MKIEQASVGFDNFRICCIIGDEPHERIEQQEIFIDLKVNADISKATISDCIDDTINYVHLAKICTEIAHQGQYRLLEKYAADVLDTLCKTYEVSSAWIRVKKPSALPGATCAYVEFTRETKAGKKINFVEGYVSRCF